MLQFTAKKPPDEESGRQPGECSQPFTLLTPDWKLAVHAGLLNSFSARGSLAETEASQRLVVAIYLIHVDRSSGQLY
jgi:hypothetical protein